MNFPVLKREIPLFFFLVIPIVVGAQLSANESVIEDKEPIEIGLALSGGGAKGFAHIGILKVFEEENIPIHMVSGTSMGSIVGSLYAIGYTPKEIEEIVLSTDWNILFNDNYRINPQNVSSSVTNKDTYMFTFPFNGKRLTLPAGLIAGQNISMMLYRLMLPYHNTRDFTKLPIPFAAVATELSTGETYTFTRGYLPDAVRASIAMPTVFTPVQINGTTYIDGGVTRNIPAEDVQKLGADIIITSDVGEPVRHVDSLSTFIDVLFQSVGFHMIESDRLQLEKTNFYIRPEIAEFSSFSYNQVRDIIERGEQAARSMLPAIKAYLQDHPALPSPFRSITSNQNDTLLVSKVSFANISGLLQQQARQAFNFQPPTLLTLPDIEKKVNRLYESGLFSQISYRLEAQPDSSANHLILEFQPKEQEFVGFSVHFDSKYKAALLFGASFTDNIFWRDRLNLQLLAGEILGVKAKYSTPVTLAPLSQLHLGLDFQRSPLAFFNGNRAVSSIKVEQLVLRPSVSVKILESALVESGLEAEVYSLNEAVGNTLVLENTSLLLQPFIKVDINTLNRPYFPTRGQSLSVKSEISDPMWGSSHTFKQLSGSWFATLRLAKKVNLASELFAGYTSTEDIPLHYNYYFGGMAQNSTFDLHQRPFMGSDTQQLRATNAIALRSELQFGLGRNIYLIGGWDAVHLADAWTLNLDTERMHYGYSLALGANSIIGPVKLLLSTPDFRGGYALKVDVGYHF